MIVGTLCGVCRYLASVTARVCPTCAACLACEGDAGAHCPCWISLRLGAVSEESVDPVRPSPHIAPSAGKDVPRPACTP